MELEKVTALNKKIRVILVTDGDKVAQQAVENIGSSLGLRCISASGGNPTPIGGKKIVELLKTVPRDPVLVMFDDKGREEKAEGERALEYVANHPDIEVLGAVAVASNTHCIHGVHADACIDCQGHVIDSSVDKKGEIKKKDACDCEPVITGDTVDVLNDVEVPVIIGVGDIGKMDKHDDLSRGAPITRKAIEEILERSGIDYVR
ncbi:stage V sporulation protein AE [Sporomusa sphaeroides DSM 2875]|uniref:stage V sporulation protein AE n=1 Tax=Sporomusa sphaeroides TaxID=47679 RepID=UPI002030664C|nr:stage V sporulation protein AE [Sporomusa sphaeroides]MCM0760077.1 stage V sporulation protein AE [Sporomusa sphaeroides DSM 2875]